MNSRIPRMLSTLTLFGCLLVAQWAFAQAPAAGQAAGPPSYTYQTGPDGKRYAVGGSVDISMSYNSGDPEASLRSARTAYASAMATGEPSGKDMAAASQALSMAARARRDGLEKYAAQAMGE